jgi:hypothetical protein
MPDARVNGILEPVVGIIGQAPEDSASSQVGSGAQEGIKTGGAIGGAVGAAAAGGLGVAAGVVGGSAGVTAGMASIAGTIGVTTASLAAAGSVVPIIGTAIGAIAGAIAGTAVAIGYVAGATKPSDAARFLYEIGYQPGTQLQTVEVLKDVPFLDKLLIMHARYLEIADRSNYGRDTVNDWLRKVGQTSGAESGNPMSLDRYFWNMTSAIAQHQVEQIMTGDGDVSVPHMNAPALPTLGPWPAHAYLLHRLRSDPNMTRHLIAELAHPEKVTTLGKLTREQRAALCGGGPAVARLAAWVDRIIQDSGDTDTSNPVRLAASCWSTAKSASGDTIEGTEHGGFLTTAAGAIYRPLGWGSGLWTKISTF